MRDGEEEVDDVGGGSRTIVRVIMKATLRTSLWMRQTEMRVRGG